MENCYTVYCHTNLINNKKYIGITRQEPKDRWRQNGKGYQTQEKFWNAIQKYGWHNFEHSILYTNLTAEEAGEKEQKLIALFDSCHNGYNADLGGTITHHSKETIAKIRSAMIGKQHTAETKEFISEYLRNKIGKTVKCLETARIYSSIIEASEDMLIDSSSIIKACTGQQLTAGGYHWCYIQNGQEQLKTRADKRKRRVKCLTTGQEYESVAEAARATNSDFSNISKVCNGKYKKTNGLEWEWVKEKDED